MRRLRISFDRAADVARILASPPADRIEIEDALDTVPRYAIHRPPDGGGLTPDGGLRAYQPPPWKLTKTSEGHAIRQLFPAGAAAREGVVWLAPMWPGADWTWKSYAEGGYLIDLAACDVARLRSTGQSEGYLVHLGPIPARAVVGPTPSER